VPEEDEKTEWKLNGQTLTMQALLTDTVNDLKAKIKDEVGGMPANKQKLKGTGLGFLVDKQTLAYYNITNYTTLVLQVKERGGKRVKK